MLYYIKYIIRYVRNEFLVEALSRESSNVMNYEPYWYGEDYKIRSFIVV